jgi:DNA-binding NarL/FixJ family response regulator
VIRVLIADDHGVLRSGLRQLLESVEGFEVAGMASDGADAARLARDEQPDVVLMDLAMPVVDGIEATRLVLEAAPDARVVALTSFADREKILAALDAGAVGYLLKDAEPDELIRGIRAAASGESPLAPRAASELLAARHEQRTSAVRLTEREREVLSLVAAGLPNKRIAVRLEISEKTVKAHLTSIFQAIGVTDRTQAALWASRHGVADDGGR